MGSEALRQVLEETQVVVRLGSAGRVSPSSRDRQAPASDAERCAGGAPSVPDRGGILEGGACPLLLYSPDTSSVQRSSTRRSLKTANATAHVTTNAPTMTKPRLPKSRLPIASKTRPRRWSWSISSWDSSTRPTNRATKTDSAVTVRL